MLIIGKQEIYSKESSQPGEKNASGRHDTQLSVLRNVHVKMYLRVWLSTRESVTLATAEGRQIPNN